MRILHVAPSLAPRHGGPTEAILGMVRALIDEGVESRIVTTDDDPEMQLEAQLGRWTIYKELPMYFVHRLVTRQHTVAGFTLAPYLVPLLWKEIPLYDLVHVHTVFSFPANVAMIIARAKRIPYAVRPMGHLSKWSLGVRKQLKQIHLLTAGKWNLNHAAFLHATSALEAEELALLGFRCPTKVIPLGIRTPPLIEDAQSKLRDRLGIHGNKPVALFLSRLHEKKGLEFLLHALATNSTMDINLVICGDGDPTYASSLRALANDLGITPRVHWLGFVQGQQKWEIVQGCDFFVLPSHSENFGIAVAEAIACGLFVIVSANVGLAKDVNRLGIGCVAAPDPISLGEAIKACVVRESFDVSARETRRSFAERHFLWKASAVQLVAAYNEAIRS